jgi:CheY-like chemotaxis protein
MPHLQQEIWRILLIDQNPFKQNLRATVLRNYEIEVHTAATARDAEVLWTTNAYDLILLAAIEHPPETVSEKIRKVRPRQRIALLVGAPTYIREVGGIPRRLPRVAPLPLRVMEEASARPQWQEMIQRMISGPLQS